MKFEEYEFATPFYALSVALRDKVLRAPLGLQFHEADLKKEWQDYHLGAFDENDELCACLVLSPNNDDVIKMRQVAVNDMVQGQGIGSKLVQYSEKCCAQKGYSKIVLNARIPAVTFYKRMNYKTVSEEFIEVGIPHYTMEKALKST